VIKNDYLRNIWKVNSRMHAPFWGEKLSIPSFYKEEKVKKFYRQWNIRIGLEKIKQRHAIMINSSDQDEKELRLIMKDEIADYLSKAYDSEREEKLKDVYVTDHQPKDKKFHTINKKDDVQFYNYK
jgi:hypothetical protein